MYIANNETAISSRGILNFMPRGIRRYMYNINLDGACEIHMRLGKPLCIHYADGCFYVNHKGNLTALPTSAVRVTREHIDEALEIATSASVYSVKEEIKKRISHNSRRTQNRHNRYGGHKRGQGVVY